MSEKKFLKAIESSYTSYLSKGARSTEKLKVLHSFIAKIIKDKLGKGYEVRSIDLEKGKEFKFTGKYYEKNLDITVLKDKKPLSAIALKFITSNYKQNGNNYFENMLGETANVRRNDLTYSQIIILRKELPYLKSGGVIGKMEEINDANLSKYLKLENDNDEGLFHKPNLTLLTFVDTGDSAILKNNLGKKMKDIATEMLPFVKVTKPSKMPHLSEPSLTYLKNHSSFDNFIEAFVHLTKAKEYGK